MNRNTKIVLGVAAGLLVLCMCAALAAAAAIAITGGSVARNVESRVGVAPARVEGVLANPIFAEQAPLTYEMPSGWREDFTLHFLGFQMIGLGGNDGHSHIFLMQLPPEKDASASLREALDAAPSNRTTYRNGMVLREVGQTTVTLRGQQVTMKISEGTNRDGDTYRQWAGAARTDTGQTLVVIEQPVKSWDQGMVDKFIASIQ